MAQFTNHNKCSQNISPILDLKHSKDDLFGGIVYIGVPPQSTYPHSRQFKI